MDYFYGFKTKECIMAERNKNKKSSNSVVGIFKIILFVAGGFLLFRNKKKLFSFAKNGNFIITLAYAVVFGFMALLYRLIIVVNWIIQQGR
jgi:hypothetical protein